MSNTSPLLSIDAFLERITLNKGTIVDVRTPAEFAQGHIPTAINVPLFSDEQRVKVGTTYTKESPEAALELGLELAGPRLAGILREVKRHAKQKEIGIYCWRGGQRSASVAWLLKFANIEVFRLQGGYQSYRRNLETVIQSQTYQFRVLGGPTGCGKTAILQEMAQQGAQVLDLEHLANHKGSAFGYQGSQPTNEMLANEIQWRLLHFDASKPIWCEGESRSIGKNVLPETLFYALQNASLAMLEMPQERRLAHVVSQYGTIDNTLLETAFVNIRKRLGFDKAQEAIELLRQGHLEAPARIALEYYDKTYSHALSKRQGVVCFTLDGAQKSFAEIASELIHNFYGTDD